MKLKLLRSVNKWIWRLGEKDFKSTRKTERIKKMKDKDQW